MWVAPQLKTFPFIDMALFGKKPASDTASDSAGGVSAPPAPKPDKKSRGFGRKKDTAPPVADPSAPGAVEDFSDFSAEALAGDPAETNGQAPVARKSKPKARSVKSGVVVGLNIGNDSIKAVELRSRGGEIAVTAMGMVPTPPDAIANGVVMSVSTLSGALRELWKGSKIKTSAVVSSVAGTGALVVRVIEVPRMTDADLAANMKVDVDRYIPFPPSEVILDFKALRDLPGDPDSPNMDVLLAAAQREIIDLHIKVLQDAKLAPKAIDVEPLAATRALQGAPRPGSADFVDYDDVSALINIGATGTEISVLRGDVLVFTRTVPIGGAALTQSISETLGLTLEAAEAAKRERGSALAPSYQNTPAADAYGAAPAYDATTFDIGAQGEAHDDWSQLESFDATPAATSSVTLAPTGVLPTTDSADAAPATATTEDPFDVDFFNQGPQTEPQERHGQQQSGGDKPDDSAFDLAGFSFAGDETQAATPAVTPESATPAVTPESAAPAAIPATDAALDLPTAAEANNATAPPPEADDIFSLSSLTSGAAAATEAPADFSGFSFSFDEPATPGVAAAPVTGTTPAAPVTGTTPAAPALSAPEAALPTAAEAFAEAETSVSVPATPSFSVTESAPTLTPFDNALPATSAIGDIPPNSSQTISFASLPSDETVPAPQQEPQDAPDFASAQTTADFAPASESSTTFSPAASESAFDLSAFEPAATTATPAAPASDFDLDALFSGTGAASPAVPATASTAADDFGTDFATPTTGFGADDFGTGSSEFGGAAFDDLSGFGAGLTADAAVGGADEAALHGAMAPMLAELSNEIRRSLEFHASRYPDAVVRHITLVGGGARLKHLKDFLEQTLGIPVAVGNPLQGLALRAPQWEAQAASEASPAFAVAIGLALRELV